MCTCCRECTAHFSWGAEHLLPQLTRIFWTFVGVITFACIFGLLSFIRRCFSDSLYSFLAIEIVVETVGVSFPNSTAQVYAALIMSNCYTLAVDYNSSRLFLPNQLKLFMCHTDIPLAKHCHLISTLPPTLLDCKNSLHWLATLLSLDERSHLIGGEFSSW